MEIDTTKGVGIEMWGKDHWSVFAYIESICVTAVRPGYGVPDLAKIQSNVNRHPGLATVTPAGTLLDGAKFGIRLKGEVELPGPDYDEWDCIDDIERHGLVENVGTGVNPVFTMTDKGRDMAERLRKHRGDGGLFADFDPAIVKPDPTGPKMQSE